MRSPYIPGALALGYKGFARFSRFRCGFPFDSVRFDNVLYMEYNYSMSDERHTLKLWKHTVPKLRLLYALTGESMVSIVDRLITQELDRVQKVPTSGNSQGIQVSDLPNE